MVKGWDEDEIERRLRKPAVQHGMLKLMETFFQPDVAYPFMGILTLQLTMADQDLKPVIWTLKLGRSSAEQHEATTEGADLLVRLPGTAFVGLLTGKVNAVEEWFEGRLVVQGDPVVAGRLVEMFGGPVPVHALGAVSNGPMG